MPPYNPNSIWTSKGNPNLPRSSRSVVPSQEPVPAQPEPQLQPQPQEHDKKSALDRPVSRDSFFRRHGLVIFFVGIVVVLGGVIAVVIYMRAPAPPATAVTIVSPSGVSVGMPFVMTVSSANDSNVTLAHAVLTLQLPDGISFVGEDPATRAKDYPQGDLTPGAVAVQSSTVIVTGDPATLMEVPAKFTYTTAQTPSTTYETDATVSFSAGPSVVSLSYTAPANIVSGQSFPVTVNYQNTGSQPAENVSLLMQYPPAFTFATSSMAVATGTNDRWNVGTLAPGQGGTFTFTGTIVGSVRAQYPITGSVLTDISGEEYAINSQPVNFVLVAAPLALSISANGSSTYVSKAGDSINYVLTYTNNSNVTLSSVNIAASLVGAMYDFTTLRTNGAFNSKTGTVTWYAANAPALTSVAPGQSGSVTFSIKTKGSFPIKQLSDKDYTLGVRGTIQSPTVLPNTSGTSTVSVTTAESKMAGDIELASKGYWQSGPYPPAVNQPTMYTVDWTITNYSTDVKDIAVSAYLQSGTSFIGTATSTVSSTPLYDPGTGLITWIIPSIAAGTGVADAPVSASFTVSNTPAVNQVGSDITLLGPTSLTSTDAFAGGLLLSNAKEITTALPDDKSLGSGIRQVVQ